MQVHLLAGGDGDGPPVLLVHATGLHARAYGPLAGRLAPPFRVWGVDVRGHGSAGQAPDGDLSWTAFGEDVLAAVDALGLVSPFGMGHSMGGCALLLAELARPGTFRSLYLYEPVVFPMGSLAGAGNPMADAARRRRRAFPSRQHAFDNYAGKPPLDELSEDSLRAYVEHGFVDVADGSVSLACPPEVEAATFEGAVTAGAFERLGEVRCPVVVARGSGEAPGPVAVAGLIADALPSGRLEVLDGLAHFGPLADEDAVAESIVRAFAT